MKNLEQSTLEKLKKGEVAATVVEEDDEEIIEAEVVSDDEEIVIEKTQTSKKRQVPEVEISEEPEVLTSKEEATIKKAMNVDSDEETKAGVVYMLNKFKNYISGKDFDKKCSEKERKTGIKKAAIKNRFIKNFLGTIADILNLTISITGDIVVGAVRFLNSIIQSVVSFSTGTLHKLIDLVTLNCGSITY